MTITTVRPAKSPSCPAPKPPPPPKPPKVDDTELAIQVACRGSVFPPEVIETLRGLLAPHVRRAKA
jgi:hypothetical protein